MRSLFERLGPIGAAVVLAWLAFVVFSLTAAPRLARTYAAFDLVVPVACAWSLRVVRSALFLIPLPVLFVWRAPHESARIAVGLGLIVAPVVLVALSCWQWFRLVGWLAE